MSDPSSVFYVVFLILVIVFAFVLTPKLDRDRIRENIEEHGGKVIEISKVWEWGRRYERSYDVSYLTARGRRVDATCRTSMWNGVDWINTHPPGFDSGGPDMSSMDYVTEEPSEPVEPVQCLSCGAMIPTNKESCLQCGWSYRAHYAGK